MSDHQQPPGGWPPEGDLPPWIVSAPPPDGPARRDPVRRRRPLVVVGLAIVLLIVGGAGYLTLHHFGVGRASTAAPRPQTTIPDVPEDPPPETEPTVAEPVPEVTTVEPVPTEDPEQDALAELDDLSRQGLTQVSLDGQYVAQLASKTPGITDPYQTAADGTHVFQATDILREHLSLRNDPRNGDATVVLLKSTDYGKRQLYQGKPLYVTFALADFGSAQNVRAWCARRFAGVSGEELTNQCAVRKLRPPS